MGLALWITSGLLAFAMVGAGGTKLVVPRVRLFVAVGRFSGL